jgi:hypothetical protein
MEPPCSGYRSCSRPLYFCYHQLHNRSGCTCAACLPARVARDECGEAMRSFYSAFMLAAILICALSIGAASTTSAQEGGQRPVGMMQGGGMGAGGMGGMGGFWGFGGMGGGFGGMGGGFGGMGGGFGGMGGFGMGGMGGTGRIGYCAGFAQANKCRPRYDRRFKTCVCAE